MARTLFGWNLSIWAKPQYLGETSVFGWNLSIRVKPQYSGETSVFRLNRSIRVKPQYSGEISVFGWNLSIRVKPQYSGETSVFGWNPKKSSNLFWPARALARQHTKPQTCPDVIDPRWNQFLPPHHTLHPTLGQKRWKKHSPLSNYLTHWAAWVSQHVLFVEDRQILGLWSISHHNFIVGYIACSYWGGRGDMFRRVLKVPKTVFTAEVLMKLV